MARSRPRQEAVSRRIVLGAGFQAGLTWLAAPLALSLSGGCKARTYRDPEQDRDEEGAAAAPSPTASTPPALTPSTPVGTVPPETTRNTPEPTRIEERSRPSPNKSARNGKISRIVLHNTEASLESTLATFSKTSSQVSAHLVVGREGEVYRVVDDAMKAWHATVANDSSLGLEIVAGKGMLGMTPVQEKTVIACVKRWMARYGIPATAITIHRVAAPRTTDCPHYIWPEGREELFLEWRRKNFGA